MKQVVTNGRVAAEAVMNGAWLGLRIFKRLSDRQSELAVNLLLRF